MSSSSARDAMLEHAPEWWRVGADLSFEAALTAGSSGTVLKYTWKEDLLLLAIAIDVVEGTEAARAAVELAWEYGGEQAVTDGFSPQRFPAKAISNAADGKRMGKRVKKGDLHVLQFFNVGAVTATPRLFVRAVRAGAGELGEGG